MERLEKQEAQLGSHLTLDCEVQKQMQVLPIFIVNIISALSDKVVFAIQVNMTNEGQKLIPPESIEQPPQNTLRRSFRIKDRAMREKDTAAAAPNDPKAHEEPQTELAHIPPHLRDAYRDLVRDTEAWAVAWNKMTRRGIRRTHHPACEQKNQALTLSC